MGTYGQQKEIAHAKIKEILRLKHDAGLSYHQIAHGVNISTTTPQNQRLDIKKETLKHQPTGKCIRFL